MQRRGRLLRVLLLGMINAFSDHSFAREMQTAQQERAQWKVSRVSLSFVNEQKRTTPSSEFDRGLVDADSKTREGIRLALAEYLNVHRISSDPSVVKDGNSWFASEEQRHYRRLDEVSASVEKFLPFVVSAFNSGAVIRVMLSTSWSNGARRFVIETPWDYPGIKRWLVCNMDRVAQPCALIRDHTGSRPVFSKDNAYFALPIDVHKIAVVNAESMSMTSTTLPTSQILSMTRDSGDGRVAFHGVRGELIIGTIPSKGDIAAVPSLLTTTISRWSTDNTQKGFFFLGSCLVFAGGPSGITCIDTKLDKIRWIVKDTQPSDEARRGYSEDAIVDSLQGVAVSVKSYFGTKFIVIFDAAGQALSSPISIEQIINDHRIDFSSSELSGVRVLKSRVVLNACGYARPTRKEVICRHLERGIDVTKPM